MRRRVVLVSLVALAVSSACAAGEPSATPEGFEARVAVVTGPDGGVGEERCLWIADTPDRRARGLMGVTDLGAADGMAFVHDEPTTGRFWMKDTLIPLSIVFYDDDGMLIGGFDMEPCTAADPADCPRYDTPVGFVVAVETRQGEAGTLGLVAGSSIEITDRACGG
jgi:uncharacterized membrane protein (UPF0127 family)